MRTVHLLRFGRVVLIGWVLLVSTASFSQCKFPAANESTFLSYSFEPLITENKMVFRITLGFKSGPKGTVKLELPSEWAGQQHIEKSITELMPLSPQTTIVDTTSPTEKELRSPPNADVRISYNLIKDWDGPLDSGTRFRADLSPSYFHIIGTTALVHPSLENDAVVDIHFDWQTLPAGWSLATSFGTDYHCQSFHGLWRDAEHSLFVGGDYRVYRTEVSGKTLNFAIRGKWTFTDEQWIDQARRIIEFERTFWRDNDFPYYLITLTPLDQSGGSTGGTSLTNAFMMHLSRLDSLGPNQLGVLAHETFHAWNSHKMGPRTGSEYQASWFSEGFTSYYQTLILFRAGLMPFPDYVDTVNARLRDYELNEGTNVPLEEFIRRHSAKDSDLHALDYRRGAVLALWLDATIRQKTSGRASLDNVMFDLVREESAYEQKHIARQLPFTNKRIFHAISKHAGRKSTKVLRQSVEQGGSLRVPEGSLGPCVQSRVETLAKFDAGFDQAVLKQGNKIVSGVEPGSEAYKAGLRDGQELTAWSIHNNDSTKQIRLTIKNSDGNQVITYYPQGEKVSVQQFQIDKDKYSADPQTCTADVRPTPAQ
jgi:predicted metalloprotease with PDZ domain